MILPLDGSQGSLNEDDVTNARTLAAGFNQISGNCFFLEKLCLRIGCANCI